MYVAKHGNDVKAYPSHLNLMAIYFSFTSLLMLESLSNWLTRSIGDFLPVDESAPGWLPLGGAAHWVSVARAFRFGNSKFQALESRKRGPRCAGLQCSVIDASFGGIETTFSLMRYGRTETTFSLMNDSGPSRAPSPYLMRLARGKFAQASQFDAQTLTLAQVFPLHSGCATAQPGLGWPSSGLAPTWNHWNPWNP